jgi:hypothetical protein
MNKKYVRTKIIMEKERLRNSGTHPLGVGISNLGSGSNKGQVIENQLQRKAQIHVVLVFLSSNKKQFVRFVENHQKWRYNL